VWLGEGLEAYVFMDDGGTGALAVWRQAEEAAPELLDLAAADKSRWYDMWGNELSSETAAAGARRGIIGPQPVIITPVNASELQTLASLDIDCPGIRADIHAQQRTLSLANHGASRLIGRLRLQPPEGWHVEPEVLKLDLAPGQTFKSPLTIKTASNAAMGDYLLSAQLYVEGQNPRTLRAQSPIRIASPGLDVRLVTRREGGALHVVQRITNQTTRLLQLRASLVCPDRLRQDRLIHDLPPGETAQR